MLMAAQPAKPLPAARASETIAARPNGRSARAQD
jgi:hypothetical protein